MRLQSVTLKQGTHHTPVLRAGVDYDKLEVLPSGVVLATSGQRQELFWEVSKAVVEPSKEKPTKGNLSGSEQAQDKPTKA